MTVVLRNVGHEYVRGPTALSEICLTISPGVTGLVGVNGAGKSTLLHTIAGVLRPSSGQVMVESIDVYGAKGGVARSRTALMPQDFRLPTDSTVLDALSYIGWLRGLRSSVVMTRAHDVLKQVDLYDKRLAKVKQLSGGMLRRLAFAQSIIAEPSILLLDEPTTGLDPEQRAGLRTLVQSRSNDVVTIVSSHLMEDLEALAQRLVVLDGGCVVFNGTMDEFVSASHDKERMSAEESFLRLLVRNRESVT